MKVEAKSYSLTGNKGHLHLSWESKKGIAPNNKTQLVKRIESMIAAEIEKHESLRKPLAKKNKKLINSK